MVVKLTVYAESAHANSSPWKNQSACLAAVVCSNALELWAEPVIPCEQRGFLLRSPPPQKIQLNNENISLFSLYIYSIQWESWSHLSCGKSQLILDITQI